MYIIAYIALLAALLAAIGGGIMAILQLWERRSDLAAKIEIPAWAVLICLFLASALLLHALFWQDYSLEYVAAYTDSYLPVFYRLTAFWAGQPGSMLFWALATAFFGWLFIFPLRRQNPSTRLWFWVFFYIIMAFFCLILTGWSNPFIMLEPVPHDGNGLNPLLQNPGMIIHPPLLFMGYAGLTIPACLGLAQLLASEGHETPWYTASRPFYLCSWIFLSAGIILGGWWAYMELGWGGYWAWDPVENASLLPWLVSTAAIHICIITRYSGKLNRMAVFLTALSVILAFFATWLTRSGVIQSVHAFGDGGVGLPLLTFVIYALIVVGITTLCSPDKSAPLGKILSREGALFMVSWIFIALTLIIATATMWPALTALQTSAAQGLDASFYNRVCLPLLTLVLLFLSACLCLNWQGGVNNKVRLLIAAGIFALAAVVIWLAGYTRPLPLIASACAYAIIGQCGIEFARKRAWRHPGLSGALGAHMGVAIMALGIAFSGPYTVEKDIMLAKGTQETAGLYSIALEDVREGHGGGYDFLQATIKISENGQPIGVLKPERRIYEKFGDMQFSEVDVLNGVFRDIYASLLGMDEDHQVLVRISLEPLINWIWIGAIIMCLLPLVSLKKANRGASPIE